ncbi:MAG TPA: hypothetical protein VGI78_02290 [Acetobacteraceae bacterium]|jgi:hypothetical protein
MTDRLTLAHAFEGAGIGREAAERIAVAVFDAIRDNVATKSDLAILKADLERSLHRLTLQGIGTLATGLGALFAALHYWPPH